MTRPRLRPLLVWCFAAPLLAVAVAACFLMAPFLGGRRAFWILAPRYIRIVARAFGIRRGLEGWEALPEAIRSGRQPAVFVGNHTSFFDPPLMISTLPCRPVFVAKRELARVPFLGWVVWLAGFIFIDRAKGKRALLSLRRAARRVRAGQSIVAFPEGTRSAEGTLLPFKKGVFSLAHEAGVPLVPVAIHGGPRILPKGQWRVAPGPYRIVVGAPVDAAAFPDADTLRRRLEADMRELLGRVNALAPAP